MSLIFSAAHPVLFIRLSHSSGSSSPTTAGDFDTFGSVVDVMFNFWRRLEVTANYPISKPSTINSLYNRAIGWLTSCYATIPADKGETQNMLALYQVPPTQSRFTTGAARTQHNLFKTNDGLSSKCTCMREQLGLDETRYRIPMTPPSAVSTLPPK